MEDIRFHIGITLWPLLMSSYKIYVLLVCQIILPLTHMNTSSRKFLKPAAIARVQKVVTCLEASGSAGYSYIGPVLYSNSYGYDCKFDYKYEYVRALGL